MSHSSRPVQRSRPVDPRLVQVHISVASTSPSNQQKTQRSAKSAVNYAPVPLFPPADGLNCSGASQPMPATPIAIPSATAPAATMASTPTIPHPSAFWSDPSQSAPTPAPASTAPPRTTAATCPSSSSSSSSSSEPKTTEPPPTTTTTASFLEAIATNTLYTFLRLVSDIETTKADVCQMAQTVKLLVDMLESQKDQTDQCEALLKELLGEARQDDPHLCKASNGLDEGDSCARHRSIRRLRSRPRRQQDQPEEQLGPSSSSSMSASSQEFETPKYPTTRKRGGGSDADDEGESDKDNGHDNNEQVLIRGRALRPHNGHVAKRSRKQAPAAPSFPQIIEILSSATETDDDSQLEKWEEQWRKGDRYNHGDGLVNVVQGEYSKSFCGQQQQQPQQGNESGDDDSSSLEGFLGSSPPTCMINSVGMADAGGEHPSETSEEPVSPASPAQPTLRERRPRAHDLWVHIPFFEGGPRLGSDNSSTLSSFDSPLSTEDF